MRWTLSGRVKKILLTDSHGDDILRLPEDEIVIGKSLGAAAFRDQVKLPDRRTVKIAEGSKITKVHTFAGYGAKKPVKVAVMLAKEYSVDKERWTHRRGDGYIEVNGEYKHAELHWFEHPDVGRVKMKVKRYFDDEG